MYRVAVVGLGRIGWGASQDPARLKPASHLEAWRTLSGRAEVVAVCDQEELRLQEVGGLPFPHEGSRCYFTDCQRMLEESVPDIVSIATPPESHRSIVKACAAAGVRLVVCEKPLATSSKDAVAMVEACHASGTILLVNHWRRFEPLLQGARALLHERIGTPTRAVAAYCQGLWTGGTHMADLLRWFLGEVGWVAAWKTEGSDEGGEEAGADLILMFRGGTRALVGSLDIRPFVEFGVTIYGERGALEIGSWGLRTSWWGTDAQYPLASGYRRRVLMSSEVASPVSPLGRMAEHALAVLDGTEVPCSTGEDGLAAVQILEAAERSAVTHGTPIVPGTA